MSNSQETTHSSEQSQWHVLQAMHGKAERAKELFTTLSINSFVPMRSASPTERKRLKRNLTPVFNHLIFVDTTLSRIKEIRSINRYLYYKCDITNENQPMIVPREEMEEFIKFVESGGQEGYEQIEYIDSNSFDIQTGERVRIIAGAFKGQEGTLVKVDGKRFKQIVVSISGVLSVEVKHPVPSRIIERI